MHAHSSLSAVLCQEIFIVFLVGVSHDSLQNKCDGRMEWLILVSIS